MYRLLNHHNDRRGVKQQHDFENQDLTRFLGASGCHSKDEMKAKDIEPDAASYDSAINSCRAVLRGLQAQSSVLPTIPDPRPKRRGRRNKRKLLWSHSKMADNGRLGYLCLNKDNKIEVSPTGRHNPKDLRTRGNGQIRSVRRQLFFSYSEFASEHLDMSQNPWLSSRKGRWLTLRGTPSPFLGQQVKGRFLWSNSGPTWSNMVQQSNSWYLSWLGGLASLGDG